MLVLKAQSTLKTIAIEISIVFVGTQNSDVSGTDC